MGDGVLKRPPVFEMERVIAGEEYVSGKVYTFRCPECGKEFTYDQPGEPTCTGPSETRDDHPHEKMLLKSVVNLDKVEKRPDDATAHARAEGSLWVPPSRDTRAD